MFLPFNGERNNLFFFTCISTWRNQTIAVVIVDDKMMMMMYDAVDRIHAISNYCRTKMRTNLA